MNLKKYTSVLAISFANRIAYPIDMISETFFIAFLFLILYYLHRATTSVAATNLTEHITIVQTMWIIFFTNIFGGDRSRGVSYTINEEILSGQIAYQLSRPYSYAVFHFAQSLGNRLPTIFFIGPIIGLMLYTIVGFAQFTVSSLLIGFLMILIGMIILFLMQFCIGLCAFWIGDVSPLCWIFFQIMMICGGASVPIALFPPFIKKILLFLPFSNIIYGAARIMVGCEAHDLLMYLGLQFFWLIVLLVLTTLFFRIGVKHVVVDGG